MKARKTFSIGKHSVKPGETKDIALKVSESYTGNPVNMFIRVIRGKEPGPAVFVTGAIHGDEFNGTGIVRELMFSDVELICGTLILIPIVNIFGFENHSRYLPDRRDLNRSFPGDPDGSFASRLADIIFREIVKKCDYGIDLHTAAIRRTNFPHVRAELKVPGIEKIAKAFGCELVLDQKGPADSLRTSACRIGCPTILYEAGEVFKFESGVIELGKRGVLNILKELKMIKGKIQSPAFQTVVKETEWVRSEHGGILRFHVRLGDIVRRGDKIATAEGWFTLEHHDVISPVNGILLGMTTMPAVKPGEPICHVAIPTKSLKAIEEEMKSSPKTLHRRLQNDLAKNFHVED